MHAELALHIIPHHPCSFSAVDTNARRIYLPIRAASAHTAPRHDADPPTQHANPAGRQQLPASQRHIDPRQPLLQTFQVVQIVHPDAHNHVHARTLEPLAAFAFVVDHATQRAAVHHLRIPVFHEPIELDHNNPTIARAPQKIDAVPFARLRIREFHLLSGRLEPAQDHRGERPRLTAVFREWRGEAEHALRGGIQQSFARGACDDLRAAGTVAERPAHDFHRRHERHAVRADGGGARGRRHPHTAHHALFARSRP